MVSQNDGPPRAAVLDAIAGAPVDWINVTTASETSPACELCERDEGLMKKGTLFVGVGATGADATGHIVVYACRECLLGGNAQIA